METDEVVGSTDPLLQIPTELSAVLTLKRNGQQITTTSSTFRPQGAAGSGAGAADADKKPGSKTPLLLKRKRESIV